MNSITQIFNYDLIDAFLKSDNKAIIYFTHKELMEVDSTDNIYSYILPEVEKILKKQSSDGSWKPVSNKHSLSSGVKYPLIETWKQLRYLIEQYGLGNIYPEVKKACEYVFSCQTDEGDIRGILANQYAPYYTGALLALLIKAGYENDPRIEKGIRWLLSMRQHDGGWVIGSPGIIGIPNLSVRELNDLTSNKNRETMKAFDKSKPFSAAGTGMVLRAFAEHPVYCKSEETLKAAKLLKSKMFKKDNWTSYQHPDNWIRFQFPFWWTNIISALDSLSKIGLPKDDIDVKNALEWLLDKQEKNGLWKISYSNIHKNTFNTKSSDMQLWISLSILRIFKRFYK
jgi:hypothetical protein